MVKLRGRLRQGYALGKFLLRERVSGFTIPSEPEFDPASLPVFAELLRGSRFYLEYGSGGSTLLAARTRKRFVSVDTDKWFLHSVGRAIGPLSTDQRLIHADIGLTGPWGKPLRSNTRSRRKLGKWRAYAATPWRIIADDDAPDLVLVDGRFRVAATLLCCQKLHRDPGARILVDDYAERPGYSVIEQHADLIRMAGRMAVFKPRPDPGESLRHTLAQHATAWE